MEKKGELEDGDPLNSFFKKIFSQVRMSRGPRQGLRAREVVVSVSFLCVQLF